MSSDPLLVGGVWAWDNEETSNWSLAFQVEDAEISLEFYQSSARDLAFFYNLPHNIQLLVVKFTSADRCFSRPLPIGLAGASVSSYQHIAFETAVSGCGAYCYPCEDHLAKPGIP